MFNVSDKLYVGLTGLATDVISLDQLLKFRCNLYKLRENREIKPATFSALLSTMLYEKRFSIRLFFLELAFYNFLFLDLVLGFVNLLWLG